MNNDTIAFWEAMKAASEGKEVEFLYENNRWIAFIPGISEINNRCMGYKWRVKKDIKIIAKAIIKDSKGGYYESDYFFETLEDVKKVYETVYENTVVKFPFGDWIEISCFNQLENR